MAISDGDPGGWVTGSDAFTHAAASLMPKVQS